MIISESEYNSSVNNYIKEPQIILSKAALQNLSAIIWSLPMKVLAMAWAAYVAMAHGPHMLPVVNKEVE